MPLVDSLREHSARLLRSLRKRPRRWILAGVAGATALPVLALVACALLFWSLSSRFQGYQPREPSRLYGAPQVLRVGDRLTADELETILRQLGYWHAPPDAGFPQGSFRRRDGGVLASLRFGPSGEAQALPREGLLEVSFEGGRIGALRRAGRPARETALEAPLLASYFSPDLRDCWAVRYEELPKMVVQAVLAAEDDQFFDHPGVSVLGILRAAAINLRAGEIRQGGSTITQQLVKNLYLSPDRTLTRKLREAMLALLLEMRYGKSQILEAYLNEIYMGASGPVNLIGLGAAARAYFGKDPARLGLDEAALLAGMIRSPGEYGPVDHPEAAVARRNEVLARMAERQWISAERASEAAARPLRIAPLPPTVPGPAPHFALAVAREASERFGIEELAARGYDVHSTLRLPDQLAAQEALERGLEAAARGWGVRPSSGAPPAPLEGALVSADPRDGAVLAYLGGRDWAASQFDRAAQAHRQAGSAFKPVVYAAAIAAGVAYPSDFLSDSPIVVRQAETEWRPRNYDRRFHGVVSMRAALEQSLNIPTVRLAVATGLPRVHETARAMGVTSPLESVPALALGSLEMTPMEMTTVYGTLASGGVRPTLHGIRTLTDSGGDTLLGPPPPAPRRALQPEVSYLVTVMLQGALARGTGAGARLSGVEGPLAGKTGTTDDRRDSWFAGYSPHRVTVVWVGHDDNSRTNLSGARAALPIWSRFLASLPAGRRAPGFSPPPGIVHAEIDPVSGFLATESCPQVVSEAFPEGRLPHLTCPLHPVGYSFAAGVAAPAGAFATSAPVGAPAAVGAAGSPPLQREVHEVEVTEEGTSEILIERAPPPGGVPPAELPPAGEGVVPPP